MIEEVILATCQEGSRMETQVRRLVIKLDDCDPQRLDSPALVWRLLRELARETWNTRLADAISRLPDGGISGFVRLGEMHISIHTRPLHRQAEINIFILSSEFAPERIDISFTNRLGASCVQTIDPTTASTSRRTLSL
jgi:S-adenosylmethionine/arginine decarboxylase-like enzyme